MSTAITRALHPSTAVADWLSPVDVIAELLVGGGTSFAGGVATGVGVAVGAVVASGASVGAGVGVVLELLSTGVVFSDPTVP